MLRRARLFVEGYGFAFPHPAGSFTNACARRYKALCKETKTVMWLLPIIVPAVIIMYLLNRYGDGLDDGDDGGRGPEPEPDPVPNEPFAWEPEDDEDLEWQLFLDRCSSDAWDHDLQKLVEPVKVA